MSFLEIDGKRQAIPAGESSIGSDSANLITLPGDAVADRHLLVQATDDGQVSVSRIGDAATQINGVGLGPQPTPLLHGDKVEIGSHELLFVDERRSGSTQFVRAEDLAKLQQLSGPKPKPKKKVATGATGGRLVSLTDGREYAILTSPLVLGRDASCDVVVASKRVSRRHAEIVPTPKGYLLVDASTNGTFVNGERIPGEQLLARADVIRLGDDEFRFYADIVKEPPGGQAPPAAAAPPAPATPAAPAAPAAAPAVPAVPAAPAAPAAPGAQHRLNDTMHGLPPDAAKGPRTPTVPSSPPVGAEYRLNDTMHGLPGGAGGPPKPPPRPQPAPAAGGVLATFLVRSGAYKGTRHPIRVPVVNIGRAEYNDIVINDPTVSTLHAKLQRREGIWFIVDLDSTNGTFVDGERIAADAPIAPGAIVRFGDVSTVFEPSDDRAPAQGGGSTAVLGALDLPASPPDQTPPASGDADADQQKRGGLWPFK